MGSSREMGFHFDRLNRLVEKGKDGEYELTELGKALIRRARLLAR